MLEVKALSRRYGEASPVLKDINLSFSQGSFTVIAGPNGSGKTQLIRHLNGLLKPQSGEILLDGVDIHKNLRETRRRIGLVFQNSDSQIVGQTVDSDIAFGPVNLKWPKERIREGVENILKELSLLEFRHRQPHSLSGGEKRRCVLAAVLVMEPDIIVLDEPFTGLDFRGVKAILQDIIQLRNKGKTIILICHDLEKVLAHADHLVILDKGQVKENADPRMLLSCLDDYGLRMPWGKNRLLETMTWLNP